MTLYLTEGDCVVQILACEQDTRRLFDDIAGHVAADRAKHAAVYEARVAIDQTRLMVRNTALPKIQQENPTKPPEKLPSLYLGHKDMTLTLLHMDTTFRFVHASGCAPGLAWPTIHESFVPSKFVDDDLILRAQYHCHGASFRKGERLITTSLVRNISLLTSLRWSSWTWVSSSARRDICQRPS